MVDAITKTKYLLDANVLLDFSLWVPISFGFNKDFWIKLGESLKNGEWVLLDVVVEEVKYDQDLAKWLKEQKQKGLVEKINANDKNRAAEINNNYKMIDDATFKSTVDTYLIAYAEANNLEIFTREGKRKSPTELYKIPDVCELLRVKYIRNPKKFLENIGFS
jgi:hypothetical protein